MKIAQKVTTTDEPRRTDYGLKMQNIFVVSSCVIDIWGSFYAVLER